MQILHDGNIHWFCVTTIGSNKGEVTILDSMKTPPSPHTVKQIAALLHSSNPVLTVHFGGSSVQNGGSECGLYAIANATELCAGLDPTTLEFDQEEMRAHLLRCLENGVMTVFPASQRTRQAPTTKKIPIFYHCQQLQSRKMIQCPNCVEWFHAGCEEVTKAAWRKPATWRCKQCL